MTSKFIKYLALVLFAVLTAISILLLIRISAIEDSISRDRVDRRMLEQNFEDLKNCFFKTYKVLYKLDPKHYPSHPGAITFDEKVMEVGENGWYAVPFGGWR